MKKPYITALLSLFVNTLYAQDPKKDTLNSAAAFTTDQSEALRNFQPKVVKASPEATAFHQISQMPVNYYSGKSQVSIPLFSLDSRKMSLPLSLSYDPSGIKVEQEATQVGLGWSLVGGMGMITKVVKGRDDFDGMFRTSLKQQNTLNKYRANSFDISPAAGNVKWQYDNYLIQYGTSGQNLQTQLSLFCTTSTDSVYILSTMLLPDIFGGALESGKPFLDGESDIYNYQAGKYSGRFIFQPQGTGFQVVTLDQSPVRIELLPNSVTGKPDYTGESGFKITTPDGMKYYYTINEKAKTRGGESSTGKLVYVESNIIDDPVYAASSVGWDVVNVDAAIPQITGWYLTKMESPDDATDFIQLNYSQDANYTAITLPNRIQNLVVNSAKWRLSDTRQKLVNLTSITSPKGSITFKRSGRLDLRGTMATKIDTIIQKDQFNRTVSRFKLNYGYFDSGTTAEEFVRKRLKLLGIEQLATDNTSKIPTHTFAYKDQASDGTVLCNKNSYQQDYWGFFNRATQNDVAVNGASGNTNPNPVLNGTLIPANLPSYATTWGFTNPANRNANLDYCSVGSLSSIIFPTGGVTTFVYELHNFQNYAVDALPNSITVSNNSSQNSTKLYGVGLRIAQSRLYETATSSNYLLKRYEYTQIDSTSSSGKLMFDLKFSQIISNGTGNPHLMFTSSPVYPNNNSANGNPIGYDRVTEREVNPTNGATNGKIVYEFINKVEQRKDRFCLQFKSDGTAYNCADAAPPAAFGTCTGYNLVFGGGAIFYNQAVYENASVPNYSHLDNGLMTFKTVFNQNYAKVTSEENVYGIITSTERIRVKNLSAVGRVTADAYPVLYTYWTDAEWIKLISKTTKQYLVSDNTNFLAQTETYGYHPVNHLVNSITTVDSKGETLVSMTTFPNDLAVAVPINIYQKMVNMNKLEVPIQQVTQNVTKGVEVQKLVYGFKEYLTNQILPETIQRYIGGQNPNRNEVVLDYDVLANVIKITPIQAPEQRFIWGYSGNYPIAEVKNAGTEKIFYNSFEDNDLVAGNWKVASSLRTQNNAYTGTQFYDLANGIIQTGTATAELLNPSVIYTLSYWSKTSAYSVNGNSTPTKTGLTVSGWTYYEHTVTGVNNAKIQGSGGIDELRMYPQTAFMTSFTENPLVGLSALSDVNGYKMSYQFDVFQRLKSIKDPQDFLLKDLNYHYQNQTALTGLGVTPTNSLNYIISRTAREVQTGTSLDSDVDKTQTQIQYSDGLGRGLEGILWKGSPDKTKDIITGLSLFDGFGRGYKQILPTPSDANTGAYKSTVETLASSFYGDASPSAETVFEPSPLNRVEKQYGAGQAWRVADKYVKMQYLLAGLGITLFDIQSSGTVNCGTSYTASTLLNYCTETERGSQIYEIKDKQGRVTHKFQQMDAGFAVTAYCYNSLGFLSFVIPPEAYNKLGPGKITSFTENDVIFKELCFGYRQDKFGRIIEKHVPGGGWSYHCYDKQDRQVMHADEADLAKGYWHFTQFDNLFRPIRKGIRAGMGSVSRATLQAAFDGMTTETYEERGTLLLGYTNRSFPTTYQISDADVRAVFYYDDFLWNTDALYNFQSTNAYHSQGFTKGLMTGKLVRNVKTNTWQKFTLHYDYRGKLIQDFHFTNKGSLIRKDYQYRFNGELLKMRIVKGNSTKIITYGYDHAGRKVFYTHNGKPIVKLSYDAIGRLNLKKFSPSGTTQGSKQTGIWTDVNNWLSGILPTLADNVTINTGQTLTIPTGEKAFAGTLNDKGILKNFGTLDMGKVTTTDLYTQTIFYHIRGGLRGINLDANGDLTNSLFSYKLAYEDDGTYFDGNIRNQYWKSSIDGVQRAFLYNYDKASRLLSATYGSTKAGENYALNGVSYDFNGNIMALSRNGYKSNNTFGLIDNLIYTYNTNSNKILKVDDTSNEIASFRDLTGNDYEYWLDGSLKKDNNKEITQIDYNYLKLPQKINLTGSRWIEYEYDAEGTKLKKTLSTGKYTDYEEDDIYENNVLYQTSHDEGRIVNGIYEYNITDHLGNLRVAFKDSSGIAKITQVNAYGAFGDDLPTLKYINSANKNRFGFNLKEEENDFGIGYTDFKWRFSDQILGRFFTIDRLAEKFPELSCFQFASNDPINKLEIDGLEGVNINPKTENLVIVIQGWDGPSTGKEGHTLVDNQVNKGGNYSNRDTELGSINSSQFPNNTEVITYTGTSGNNTVNDVLATVYGYKQNNPNGNVYMIGHSQGAENIETASEKLNAYGIKINGVVTLDPASASSASKSDLTMSPNVQNVANISALPNGYPNFSGGTVSASDPNKTDVKNFKTTNARTTHTNIDDTFVKTAVQMINSFMNSSTASGLKNIYTAPHKDKKKEGGSSN